MNQIVKNKSLRLYLAIFMFVFFAGFLFLGNARIIKAGPYSDGGGDIGMTQTNYATGAQTTVDEVKNSADVCDASIVNIIGTFKCLLLGVLGLVKLLLSISGIIFAWIVDVKNFNYVVDNKEIIYPIWRQVRDLLNIAFILVLLYSAFCTILQIEKYNYKKIMLNLVIMALLVNFSFPITRFIIDIANTLMYTLIKDLLAGGDGTLPNIAGQSGILPAFKASSSSFLSIITAIVFGFILAITLLSVGILLVVRTIALALLIIFSPLAFVGTILPGAGNYSSKWWDSLFRYSFFGPIMIFAIYITTHIISKMPATQTAMTQLAGKESLTPELAGSLAFFALPIVLLWMSMGIANSMSIAGAGAVMGGAQKFIKGAGKFVGQAPFKTAWWGMKKTGVPGGIQQKFANFKKTGFFGSDAQAQREAARAGKGLFAVKGAGQRDIQRRSDEYKKNFESVTSLQQKCSAGDAAACHRLASDGKMDATTYANMKTKKMDSDLMELIDGKVKEKRIDVVIDYKINSTKVAAQSSGASWTHADEVRIAEAELNRLSPDKWKDQKISELLGGANSLAKIDAAQNIYNEFNQKNQDKVTDNMSGENYITGKGTIWP